jgi:hypothetical protein
MAKCLVLECVKEEGVQVVSVVAVLASSWRRRRWRWPAFPARNRGAGELGLEREKGSSTEREGRGFPDRRQPSPFAVGLLLARVLSNGERSWFPWRRGSAVREREWRGNK